MPREDLDRFVSPLVAKILNLMLRHPTRAWRNKELCDGTGHPSGAVCGALSKLIDQGWVAYRAVVQKGESALPRRRYVLTELGATEAFGVLLALAENYAPPGVEVRQTRPGPAGGVPAGPDVPLEAVDGHLVSCA